MAQGTWAPGGCCVGPEGAWDRSLARPSREPDRYVIYEDACSFFQNGWFEKAVELQERYNDSVVEEPAAAAEPAAE